METEKPSQRLRVLVAGLPHGPATLGDVMHGLEHSARGLILLFLAIPAMIPTPGFPAGMIFGSILVLVSIQMVRGRRLVSLPGWIARRQVPRGLLDAVLERGSGWLERVERRLRPRLDALVHPPAERLLGVLVLVQAVLIALPIPFGNTLPGMAVIGIALGLIARDGLAVATGLGLSALAVITSAGLVWGTWYLVAGA